MTNEGQTKLDRWLIFIVVILCISILIGIIIYGYINSVPPEPIPPLKGDLLYLSNISDPNDESIGVWLELILKHPLKIGYGEYTQISIWQNNECIAKAWINNSVVHTKNNITIEHFDLDNDTAISSHDKFHIYGWILTNSRIILEMRGYEGKLSVNIP